MQRPECDCGNGVPGYYDFTNCYGNTFYLGIYGAIGVSVGIFSFTKENGFDLNAKKINSRKPLFDLDQQHTGGTDQSTSFAFISCHHNTCRIMSNL